VAIAIDVASAFATDKLNIKGFATAFERRQIAGFGDLDSL
jgi:hypothetical protein